MMSGAADGNMFLALQIIKHQMHIEEPSRLIIWYSDHAKSSQVPWVSRAGWLEAWNEHTHHHIDEQAAEEGRHPICGDLQAALLHHSRSGHDHHHMSKQSADGHGRKSLVGRYPPARMLSKCCPRCGGELLVVWDIRGCQNGPALMEVFRRINVELRTFRRRCQACYKSWIQS